jgi:hypothetical protein
VRFINYAHPAGAKAAANAEAFGTEKVVRVLAHLPEVETKQASARM